MRLFSEPQPHCRRHDRKKMERKLHPQSSLEQDLAGPVTLPSLNLVFGDVTSRLGFFSGFERVASSAHIPQGYRQRWITAFSPVKLVIRPFHMAAQTKEQQTSASSTMPRNCSPSLSILKLAASDITDSRLADLVILSRMGTYRQVLWESKRESVGDLSMIHGAVVV